MIGHYVSFLVYNLNRKELSNTASQVIYFHILIYKNSIYIDKSEKLS